MKTFIVVLNSPKSGPKEKQIQLKADRMLLSCDAVLFASGTDNITAVFPVSSVKYAYVKE